MTRSSFSLGGLLLFISTCLWAAPSIDPAEDHLHFGLPENNLFWTPEEQVAGYRNSARIFPTRQIEAGTNPLPLPEGEPLPESIVEALETYVAERDVAGLLVLHRGRLRYERYALGNTEHTLWVSFSVAKSITSLLVGAALQDGSLASLEDKVSDYLPALADSAYAEVNIRQLLQMRSGVAWNEDYSDPGADINQIPWPTQAAQAYLADRPRVADPGMSFNYNTAETNLVGDIVRAATGESLAGYLSRKIWRPFGMQAAGNWELVEPGGAEYGGSSINATLRDYGRLGLFVLQRGRLPNGTATLAPDWIQQSTTAAGTHPAYGYQWWLGSDGSFQAQGIFGQAIYIDPGSELVIALNSAWPVAADADYFAARDKLFARIREELMLRDE